MKTAFIMLLLSGAAFISTFSLPKSVLIQSKESKNKDQGPVFNEIIYKKGKNQDEWFMAQSHDGINHPKGKWDQIKIIVDKSTTPYSASYHQIKDGKEIELRAACFICHSNGPRAIRPDYSSPLVKYTLMDRMKIQAMNLRIKTYGRVMMKKTNLILDGKPRTRPLTYNGPQNWKELNIPTCLKCHSGEDGFFTRSKLKWQQSGTINHLAKTGAMPPWPYSLSSEEKKQLQKFLAGK